jgi:hypothetical protein
LKRPCKLAFLSLKAAPMFEQSLSQRLLLFDQGFFIIFAIFSIKNLQHWQTLITSFPKII